MKDLIDRMYKHPFVTCMIIGAIGKALGKILHGSKATVKKTGSK